MLSLETDEDLVKKYGNMDSMQKEAMKMFLNSASLFVELNKPNEAGKCYFAAEKYEEALECFRQSDNKLNLAHTYFMLRQYESALPLYYELEQDDMVQACLYNLSENGKDMKRFAALLATMSDEVKEVAKYDDTTFLRYIKNVFDELQSEIKDAEELEELGEDAGEDDRQQNEGGDEINEKSESNSFVVVNESKSDNGYSEIKSLLSEMQSVGGSFEKLPSLRSEAAADLKQAMSDKIENKLSAHQKRLQSLVQHMPGSRVLFSTVDQTIKNLMFDLAIIFRLEDIGLEVLKNAQGVDREKVFGKLMVNKLLNLDSNVVGSKKVDVTKPTNSKSDNKGHLQEIYTLNVFDIMSAYKLGEFKSTGIVSANDIVRHLFKHIAVMGLGEFFYPLTTDSKVREQLVSFISVADRQKLQDL